MELLIAIGVTLLVLMLIGIGVSIINERMRPS